MTNETASQSSAKTSGKGRSFFGKINDILDRSQKLQFLVLGVMILIGGLFETLGVSLLVPIVSVLLDSEALHAFLKENSALAEVLDKLGLRTDLSIVLSLLGALILVYIVKNSYLLFMIRRQNTFISRAKNDMISRVMREFLNRPYEEYLGADIPTVFRITDSDIPTTFALLLTLLNLCTELVVSVFLCAVLIRVNWKMTLFIILVLLCMTLLNSKVLKPRLNRIGQRNQSIQSRIAKWRIQAIYGLKDVKVLNRQDFFIRNYYESGRIGADVARNYAILNNLPRLLIETVFMVSILGYMMFYLASGGDVKVLVPQLLAFGVAASRILPSANRINTYLAEIAYEQPCLDYVHANLTREMKEGGGMHATGYESTGPALQFGEKLELKNISFHYPDSEKWIFRGADMTVPRGSSVGIMGASGAGKSTIVDILLGLLHAQEGEILCDGRSIFENYDSWLAMIGYIPQTIYLVDESIRDNIAFGVDADKIDEGKLRKAIEEAQLAEFVDSLPEGLDTRIGDRGVRLSGGQRQRIGIARALYNDPPILVFDEATSALDNETEAALMEAIGSFKGRKTMIIIAHRLNTIADCDVIYKVEEEKIHTTTLEGQAIYHAES